MDSKRPFLGLALAACLLAVAGCGSAPPGAPERPIGTTHPGFARSLDGAIAIAPTLPGPGRQPAPSTVEAIAEDLVVELFVDRAGDLVGPEDVARRLAGTGTSLRSLVAALARGDRVVPDDYAPLAAALEAPFVLLSWADETERTGREAVRPDVELTDPSAETSRARYRAIDGVLEARLVDLSGGALLWEARATYTTDSVFEGEVTGDVLRRSRTVAATTVARALLAAWERARSPSSLD